MELSQSVIPSELKSLFSCLKKSLGYFSLSLKQLLLKLFGDIPKPMRKEEFARMAKFADKTLKLREINALYEQLSESGEVTVESMETELGMVETKAQPHTTLEKLDEAMQSMLIEMNIARRAVHDEGLSGVFTQMDKQSETMPKERQEPLQLQDGSDEMLDLKLRLEGIQFTLQLLVGMFRFKSAPKNTKMATPAKGLLARNDKELISIYVKKSKAPKEDIDKFQKETGAAQPLTKHAGSKSRGELIKPSTATDPKKDPEVTPPRSKLTEIPPFRTKTSKTVTIKQEPPVEKPETIVTPKKEPQKIQVPRPPKKDSPSTGQIKAGTPKASTNIEPRGFQRNKTISSLEPEVPKPTTVDTKQQPKEKLIGESKTQTSHNKSVAELPKPRPETHRGDQPSKRPSVGNFDPLVRPKTAQEIKKPEVLSKEPSFQFPEGGYFTQQAVEPVVEPVTQVDNKKALTYYRAKQVHTTLVDLMSFFIKEKQRFVDDEIPATSKGEFVHAKDIFRGQFFLFKMASSIFDREEQRTGLSRYLEPKDIQQGHLGNCYFLSSVAALVNYYPELLSEMFLFDINPTGLYAVRLFNDGEWTNILMDDRFPCMKGKPAFASPHGNEIWVMLLEKAWAKLHGSYMNIESGSTYEALTALTGAPCQRYVAQQHDILKTLKELPEGSVVTCGGSDYLNSIPKEVGKTIGLFGRHAYTFQRMVEIQYEGKILVLVKLRNPWGTSQWKGDWGFESDKWTEPLRKQCSYTKDPKDGSFYMPWHEFEKYFSRIVLCKLVPKAVNSSLRVNCTKENSGYASMKIVQKGVYTISLYQQSKRKYKNSADYELSEGRLVIMRLKNNRTLQWVASRIKSRRNIHIQVALEEGEYVINFRVFWKFFDSHDCVIASYGPALVSFFAHKDREINTFFKSQMIRSYAKQNPDPNRHYSFKSERGAWQDSVFSLEHGIGYIHAKNSTDRSFTTPISSTGSKGIYPIKPTEANMILSVVPGTDFLAGFFVSAHGFRHKS